MSMLQYLGLTESEENSAAHPVIRQLPAPIASFLCLCLLQGEAVSVAEHQKIQDMLSMAQRRLVSTELELQAAREKLEVYRRTEVPQGMLADMGDPRSSASHADASKGLRAGAMGDAHLTPDGDKSAEEMRRELLQLRAVYMTEKADLAKVLVTALCDWNVHDHVGAEALLELAECQQAP
jgi:hypothetical protein